MELFNFNTAYTQAREELGMELNPDEFETLGMIAWNKIGNKQYILNTAVLPVNPSENKNTGYVYLPCSVDKIESVTLGFPDYQRTSNLQETPLVRNQYIEKYIDSRKGIGQDALYKPGKYINYRIVDDKTLEVSMSEGHVIVLYKTVNYDENELPLLTNKEVSAIAAYCVYSILFRQAIKTRDQATLNLSQIMEQKWQKLCDNARTPNHLSQNDFDKIGDVVYSWDRKSYGKSFKPIR